MRFCGNCGASVDPSVRTTGVCSACGVSIAPSGDLLDTQSTPATLYAVRDPASVPMGVAGSDDLATSPGRSSRLAAVPPAGFAGPPTTPPWPRPPRPRRSRGPLVLIGVLAVGVLVLAAALAVALGPLRNGLASGQFAPIATVTTASGSATRPTARTTPTTMPTVAGTATPVASPSPAPTSTPTPVPVLSVSPTNMSAGVCAASQHTFTVANTGGGSMNWTATASDSGYNLEPASGTLAGGAPAQKVTISQINGPGHITVSAAGASGSPKIVMISCTVSP